MEDTPDVEDIPINFEEIPVEARMAMDIFSRLPELTEMTDAGILCKGKDLSCVEYFFNVNSIPMKMQLTVSKVIDILNVRFSNECAEKYNKQVKEFNRKMKKC